MTVVDAPPIDEIALGDPRFFLRPDVDAAFARLRAESPVHRTTDLGEPRGPAFWSVTRYDDVRTVSRDHASFHNAPNMTIEDYERSGNSILHLDPPEHTRLRLIVNKGFTPRMIERMTDDIRARTIALIDAIDADEEWELVGSFAVQLPLQVICELLGVPESDEAWLLECLMRTFGASDPDDRGTDRGTRPGHGGDGCVRARTRSTPTRRSPRRPHHRARARRGRRRRR